MYFDTTISEKHNGYSCRIINALRDFEVAHGRDIEPEPHILEGDCTTWGCYATKDSVLLGGLLFSIHRQWVFLSSGFVWPIYRRQGIYSAIMQHIEKYARESGCNGIFVSTYTFEAPHIYEHMGFTRGTVLRNIPKGNTSIDYYKELEGEKQNGYIQISAGNNRKAVCARGQ